MEARPVGTHYVVESSEDPKAFVIQPASLHGALLQRAKNPV